MTSYRMPWDIVTGAAYRYTGGLNSFASNAFGASPMARVVLARDTTTLTQYQIRVEENGDYRQDGVNVLDLRASKLFRIRNFRIEGMIDVFNVFNANNVLAAGTITAQQLRSADEHPDAARDALRRQVRVLAPPPGPGPERCTTPSGSGLPTSNSQSRSTPGPSWRSTFRSFRSRSH